MSRLLALVRARSGSPEMDNNLLCAWEDLATYAAQCDDDDKPAVVKVLNMIQQLIADLDDTDPDAPTPATTFGLVTQTPERAAETFSCPKCSRNFSTEAGLINHLKQVHSQREHTPYKKNSPNQTQD